MDGAALATEPTAVWGVTDGSWQVPRCGRRVIVSIPFCLCDGGSFAFSLPLTDSPSDRTEHCPLPLVQVPTNRQTMMFTATWPREVRRLAEEFLRDPVHVQIGTTDALQANPDIDQRVAIVNSSWDKQQKLLQLLSTGVRYGC